MVRPRLINLVVGLAAVLLLFTVLSHAAPTPVPPGDLYREGYLLFQKAEQAFNRGEFAEAAAGYRRAAGYFTAIREQSPGWSAESIESRLESCRLRIAAAATARAEEESWRNPLEIHFIDVGQGDCTLIRCPSGETILIDGGRIWVYSFLIDYLRRAGVKKIDLLVVSHPHGDHYGGLFKVLETFPITTLLDSGKEDTSEHYERYLQTVKSHDDILFKLARAGDRLSFGDVQLLIMHPSYRLLESPNNCSIVVKLVYGDESFLFTGDAEEEAEMEMLSRGCNLKSGVLKIGHHGSRTSTGSSFLSRVAPREAVIPVGENNSYGHPTDQVLRRLQMRRITIYRTDRDGTILYRSNGREHRVEFPGKAVYPEYDIPKEMIGKVAANRHTLIYYPPRSAYSRRIPPEDREYFDTATAAEAAGYRRYWY
ncbi:MAG: MBL fold metallo-hydrolase [PVC group bacterium]